MSTTELKQNNIKSYKENSLLLGIHLKFEKWYPYRVVGAQIPDISINSTENDIEFSTMVP
jgi:hypothetical protein